MNKYGLSDFWYKDMMLTHKKLKRNGSKTVSMDLAAANIRDYLSREEVLKNGAKT